MYKKMQTVNTGTILMLKNNDEFKINSPIFNFLYRLSHSVLTYFWGILLEDISVCVGLIFDIYGK